MTFRSPWFHSLCVSTLITFVLPACASGGPVAFSSPTTKFSSSAPVAKVASNPIQMPTSEEPLPDPPPPVTPPAVLDDVSSPLALPDPVSAAPTMPPSVVNVVDGYVDRSSYAPGDTQTVFLNAVRTVFGTVQLTDIAGRVVAKVDVYVRPQTPTTTHPYADGFGYAPSFHYLIPPLSSGVYFWAGQVPFIIRDPEPTLPITVLIETNTINAYNCAGGLSFYHCAKELPLVPSVSFQRPQPFKKAFSFPFLEWVKREGLDVRYIADSDMDDPAVLKGTRLLIVPGHSEYWSAKARYTFDTYVKQGGNAAILSGNTLWWKVRYSADGHNLICYKQGSDPVQDANSTGRWDNKRFEAPISSSIGTAFPFGGYLDVNSDSGYTVLHPESPIFRNTSITASSAFLPLARPGNRFETDGLAGYVPGSTSDSDVAQQLGVNRAEVLAYMPTYDPLVNPVVASVSTMVLVQKHPGEGVVFNASLNGWAQQLIPSVPAHDMFSQITRNIIQSLSQGQDPW